MSDRTQYDRNPYGAAPDDDSQDADAEHGRAEHHAPERAHADEPRSEREGVRDIEVPARYLSPQESFRREMAEIDHSEKRFRKRIGATLAGVVVIGSAAGLWGYSRMQRSAQHRRAAVVAAAEPAPAAPKYIQVNTENGDAIIGGAKKPKTVRATGTDSAGSAVAKANRNRATGADSTDGAGKEVASENLPTKVSGSVSWDAKAKKPILKLDGGIAVGGVAGELKILSLQAVGNGFQIIPLVTFGDEPNIRYLQFTNPVVVTRGDAMENATWESNAVQEVFKHK